MSLKPSVRKRIFFKSFLSVIFLTLLINWISFYLYTNDVKTYFLSKAQSEISNNIESNLLLMNKISSSSFCEKVENQKRYRLTLVSLDGKVLCDSFNTDFDNHLDRPEIKNSKLNQISYSTRYSNSTNQEMVYGAQKVLIENKAYFLRAAIPLISIESELANLYQNTLTKVVPFLALAVLLFFFISFRFSKTISKIFYKVFNIGQKLETQQDESINFSNLENILDQVDTEFDKNFEALRFEIEKNSTLLQSISDGILAIDLNKRILFYNVRFTRFFNYSKATQNNLAELLGSEISKAFDLCLATGKEQRVFGLSIEQKIVDLSIAPILDKTKQTLGAIGIFRNVTEKKKNEQMRVEFVANVSHELKTPLTSIKGYSQLLLEEDNSLNDKSKKYIDKILKNSEKLIGLFENLLNLSKVESKDLLEYSNFDIEEHVQEIIQHLISDNPEKNINITQDYQVKNLTVNEKLFSQVLFNLLENAVKYSKQDVDINIQTRKDQDRSIISIKDNGIGISEEKLNRVFERFYRANESRSSEIKGSGIGLSIVKHIINKHKGEIEVVSLEEGTEFVIKI